MKTKLLSAVAALPLLALAGAASATEPVTLNDVQMDSVSAAGLVLFKFAAIATGNPSSAQVIFAGQSLPGLSVTSEASKIVNVASTGTFSSLAISTAIADFVAPPPVVVIPN